MSSRRRRSSRDSPSSFAFRSTAALTGRIGLGAPNYDDLPEEDAKGLKKEYTQQKAGSVMEMKTATPEEESIMRNVSVRSPFFVVYDAFETDLPRSSSLAQQAVIEREGLLADIFTMLRSVPRRILIVIKLNDLTRR